MRSAFVVASVIACGPGLRPIADPQTTGREAIIAASGDPGAFERLVRGPIVNGGLWFDEPACSAEFGKPAEIPVGRRVAFAHCLANLRLQRSTREDALGDVIVLEYGAGFEVEARVVPENDGPRLTWIGFESRRNDQDNAPTISLHALEKLRTAGDLSGPLDPAIAATLELDPTPKSHAAYAWFKVCLDETGAVREAHVHETTSVKAKDAFLAAIKAWKFRPFMLQEQPVPVCSMVRMTYPFGQGPETEVLPLPPAPTRTKREPMVFAEGTKHSLIEGRRIAGNKAIVPDDDTKSAIRDAGVERVQGSFRLCMDETGKVDSVLPLRSTGFAAYDRRIMGGILSWLYSPYMIDGQAVAVCTSVTFIYTQRGRSR
jgi:hypothetical protein